jgi:type III pantothenate kinase
MLAIDVGNTHITSAFMEGVEVRFVRRLSTASCLQSGKFFHHMEEDIPQTGGEFVLSSVRREVTELITRECEERFGKTPCVVTGGTFMGITNRYRTKATLGTDRLVNIAACHHLYTRGQRPGIVIDMGTATTIDYYTKSGKFLGGAIAPGLVSACRGLLSAAPELPEIEISPVEGVIATTTRDCIRSGVIAGHAAMVQGMASLMARGRRPRPLVVVTGGLLPVVGDRLPREYIRDEHLMVKGLSIVYQLQGKNS